MTFQIHPLPYDTFAPLFDLDDAGLARKLSCRRVVSKSPGAPCRVSLEDAKVGETVILTHWEHQGADTPFKASHAIYVRENAVEATPAADEVPPFFLHRTQSLRAFGEDGMMIDANVVEGPDLKDGLTDLFARTGASEIHIHFAGPDCFAARAIPA